MSEIDEARAALKTTDEKLRAAYLSADADYKLYDVLHEVLTHISDELAKFKQADIGEPATYMEFITLVGIQELISKELG